MNSYEQEGVTVGAVELPRPFNVGQWLDEQPGDFEWLLAHAYAGVIWGRRFPHDWELSSGRIPSSPPLTAATLVQLRVFGEQGEIFIWRAGGELHARRVLEVGGADQDLDVIDEVQLLWGSKGQQIDDYFTRLEDGDQGMVHAVPLTLGSFDARSWRPVQLHVRHYLTRHPETGLARIGHSRLRTLYSHGGR